MHNSLMPFLPQSVHIMENTPSGLSLLDFVPLGALAIAVWAVVHSFRTYHNVSWSQQVLNVRDAFISDYLDRKLRSEPEVSASQFGENWEPIKERFFTNVQNGNSLKLVTLKDARQLAAFMLKEDFVNWEDFLTKTDVLNSWENRLAYEIGLAMNRLGALILSGAVPVGPVLALAARQFLQDYCYAKAHLGSIQTEAGQLETRASKPWGASKMDRRHAVWLAHASALHLLRQWKPKGRKWWAIAADELTDPEVHLVRAFGEPHPDGGAAVDIRKLENVERRIRFSDAAFGMVPIDANRAISKAIGYTYWNRLKDPFKSRIQRICARR